jgi:hypothetical protein
MSPADILAKFTGLDAEMATLKASLTTSATALSTEVQARAALEIKLKASESLATAQAATIAELTKAAAAVPAVDPDEEKGKSDAQGMLEAVLEFIKGLIGTPGADDPDAKADGDMDAAEDTEAKNALAKGHKAVAVAIRAKTVQRKVKAFQKNFIPKAALPKEVAKQISALGIPAPLALNKDGQNPIRAEVPDGRKRAHKLIASGFNEQPAVAALNLSLGRNVRN